MMIKFWLFYALQLSSLVNIDLGSNVNAAIVASLPDQELVSNLRAETAGWGLTGDEVSPKFLQKIPVITMSGEDCWERDRGATVTNRHDLLCTRDEHGYRGLGEVITLLLKAKKFLFLLNILDGRTNNF